MKKKLTNNLFLKISSLLLAFILWLVVVNINDPDKTVRINRIPVTIVNEETLTGQGIGQIYEIIYPPSGEVSVMVKGPRSIVDNLTGLSEGVSATVDFSELSKVDAVPIKVSLPDGVTQVSMPDTMRIQWEALAMNTFNVDVSTSGTAADGFLVGDRSVSPNRVRITAPESVLNQIRRVTVVADIDGRSDNIQSAEQLLLLDANGDEIEYAGNEHITFSTNSLNVKITMLKTAELEVLMEADGEVARGYRYTGLEASKNTVMVKGLPDMISQTGPIEVQDAGGLLDVSDLSENHQVIIDLDEYLPPGVSLLHEEDREVTVLLRVERLYEKEVGIMAENITIINQPADLVLSYPDLNPATAALRGLARDLETVSALELQPNIQLEGLSEGTHTLPLNVTLPNRVELLNTLTVNIVLMQLEDEIEETTEITTEVEDSGEHDSLVE